MYPPDYIDAMRARLIAQREALRSVADAADASAEVVELDQSKVGRLSRVDALQAQSMAKAGIERREQAMRRIAGALQRIERGDYGICEDCEEPISAKRLEADPTATLCIRCAERRESP